MAKLERDLEAAVAAEEYTEAARLRDQLAAALHDGTVAVTHANNMFYSAFATCDMAAMGRVWGDGDHVRCIHPTTQPITGAHPSRPSGWLALVAGARGLQEFVLPDEITYFHCADFVLGARLLQGGRL